MRRAQRRSAMAVALLIVACQASACTVQVGRLSAASTKSLPADFDVVAEKVEGKDCARSILIIPIGKLTASIDEALGNALAQAPEADALVDATTSLASIPAIIYTQSCWRVEGTAVRTR